MFYIQNISKDFSNSDTSFSNTNFSQHVIQVNNWLVFNTHTLILTRLVRLESDFFLVFALVGIVIA